MAVTGGILEEISRVIAEHLGKPGNLATLDRCVDKWLGYENWLQIEVLNALIDAGLHPEYLEMWIDAPYGLTRPCKPRVKSPVKWPDWVLYVPKEQEYLWVELKTVPSAKVSSIEEDMGCLDLFSLEGTVRLWEKPSRKQSKYLTRKVSSLVRATHRGICILAGTTDLEPQLFRDKPKWGPPGRYEVGGQFALWVWERHLEKGL